MKYDIDTETREFLESVLNIVVGVAELQYDDTAKNGLHSLVEILADRFDIPTVYVEVDENGDVTMTDGDQGAGENLASTMPEDPDGTVH